jgi:hypothetical protein
MSTVNAEEAHLSATPEAVSRRVDGQGCALPPSSVDQPRQGPFDPDNIEIDIRPLDSFNH